MRLSALAALFAAAAIWQRGCLLNGWFRFLVEPFGFLFLASVGHGWSLQKRMAQDSISVGSTSLMGAQRVPNFVVGNAGRRVVGAIMNRASRTP